MTRWQRALAGLRPDCLLTVPVVLGSYIGAIVPHFLDPVGNGTGQVPLRLAMLAALQLMVFVLPAIAWLLLRSRLTAGAMTAALLGALLVGATIRGLAFAWAMYAADLVPVVDYRYRVATSLVQNLGVILLLWAAVTGIRGHNERLQQLLSERARLEALQTQAAGQLRELDVAAAEQVRVSILEGLGGGEPAEGEVVLQRLRLTVEEVVRPLSRQLESQADAWVAPEAAAQEHRISWTRVLRDAADPRCIRVLPTAGVIMWMTVMSVVAFGPLLGALLMAAVVVVLVPVLWGARAAGVWISRTSGPFLRAVCMLSALVLAGLAYGLAAATASRWLGLATPYFNAALALTLLFGVLVAIVESARRQARAVEEDLFVVTQDMRWALARAREEHRQHRLALAHAVHGSIQATLSAAVLQLDRAVREGAADAAMIAEVQKRVVGCLADLDPRSQPSDSLPDLLDKLQTTWAGLAGVTLDTDEPVELALDEDPQCLRCINDLLPELVFNSIKHGHAARVEVVLRMQPPRGLELVVSDDGGTPGAPARSGMGTRLLEDCAMEWSRERQGQVTVTRAVLPVLSDTGLEVGQVAAVGAP